MIDEQQRRQYRLGYLAGWSAGICAFVDQIPIDVLMQDRKPVGAAYVKCKAYCRHQLQRWANGDCTRARLVPDLEMWLDE